MKIETLEVALNHSSKGLKMNYKPLDSISNASLTRKNTIPKGLMIQRSIVSNPAARKKLVIRNDKYFSSVKACDEECLSTLNNIKRNKGVKLIQSLSFDSSQSKGSGISQLQKVLYKMPMMKKLDLTISKVNYRNECAAIGNMLSRISRLKAYKLRLIKLGNVSSYGLLKVAYGIRNCQLIKDYDLHLISIPGHTDCKKVKDRIKIMKKLERLNFVVSKNMDVKNGSHSNECYVLPKLPKLKHCSVKIVKDSSWSLMPGNDKGFLSTVLESFGTSVNPESFQCILDDHTMLPETISSLMGSLGKMTNLQNLSLHFNNSKLEDMEVEYLSALLRQFKHLENLEVSIKEKTNLCSSTIFDFVKTITQCQNITNVKINIGVVFSLKNESQVVSKKIASLDNISYSFTDDLISVTKREL